MDERRIDDQVRGHARSGGGVLLRVAQHPHHEVVIRVRFVHEALATTVHRNEPGFRAIEDDVRPDAVIVRISVAGTLDRAGHPEAGAVAAVVHICANMLGAVHAVAGVGLRRERKAARAGGEELIAQRRVARDAARCQHHAAARPNAPVSPAWRRDERACYTAAFAHELDEGRLEAHFHVRCWQAARHRDGRS